MVRVNHFEAVPCKSTQQKVKKLFREQLRIEGKPLPPDDDDLSSPTADDSSSNSSPPRPTLLHRQSSTRLSQIDQADRLLEQHMPSAVTCFSGSLRSGRIRAELPLGTLHIDVDVRGKKIKRCQLESEQIVPWKVYSHSEDSAGSYHELALAVLRLIEQQCERQSTTKTILERLLHPKQALRTHNLHQLFRKEPRAICEGANAGKNGWHFIKAERILNPALEQRFLSRTEKLREELRTLSIGQLSECLPMGSNAKSKHAMIEELLRPQYTFHGTNSSIVDSIAQHGLLAAGDINPATGLPIGKKLGSTYGPGVYVTQEPHLAITYSNWSDPELLDIDPFERAVGETRKRVIICASVLGRAALVTPKDGFREKTEMFPGAHSHVANGGQEYVLPREQVLPLYVVDFDWRPEGDEYREAYVAYAESMVSPPVDDVDVQGRWWRMGGT